MYGYNAEPPIAIPIYTVLPYCVIPFLNCIYLSLVLFLLLLVITLDTEHLIIILLGLVNIRSKGLMEQ